MKRFKPSAKPCVNCRKVKYRHNNFRGVLFCPRILSKIEPSTPWKDVTYQPMFIVKKTFDVGAPAPGAVFYAD